MDDKHCIIEMSSVTIDRHYTLEIFFTAEHCIRIAFFV